MNEYEHTPEVSGNKAEEPSAAYGVYASDAEKPGRIFNQMLDELLRQSNDVKLMVISRLVESMRSKPSKVVPHVVATTLGDDMSVSMTEARQYVKALSLRGEIEVPSDERGIDALLDMKY